MIEKDNDKEKIKRKEIKEEVIPVLQAVVLIHLILQANRGKKLAKNKAKLKRNKRNKSKHKLNLRTIHMILIKLDQNQSQDFL